MSEIDLQNMCGFEYLEKVEDGSVDLVLTDPPYIISRETGMDTHYNKVKKNEEENVKHDKTEAEWQQYKEANEIEDDTKKKYFKIQNKALCSKWKNPKIFTILVRKIRKWTNIFVQNQKFHFQIIKIKKSRPD